MKPDDVNFYNVLIGEVPHKATGLTGYYTVNIPKNHDKTTGAGHWIPLKENKWRDNVRAGSNCIPPWSQTNSPSFSGGSFSWPVPVVWKVKGVANTAANLHKLGVCWQQDLILTSNGTVTIKKFGVEITRTTNSVYTIK